MSFVQRAYLQKKQTFYNSARTQNQLSPRIGFDNWKKATERFSKHQNSLAHKEAQLKLSSISKGEDVKVNLSEALCLQQQERQSALLVLLTSIRYLLRQGLAFRGHDDNEGNLRQLLYARQEECPQLKCLIEKGSYLSSDIINEIITMFGNAVLRKILEDVHRAKWYGLIADEVSDVTNKEQLSICVRYVTDNFEVFEDFLGFF